MSDECIHGFDNGMCAICNPKPVPETAAAPRSAPRSRTAAPARTATRVPRAATRVPSGPSPADALLEQRIYHLTHISNLPGIVDQGALVAGTTPELDLSPAELRAERPEIVLALPGSTTLDDFVPFFLSPDASLWQSLRVGLPHPRISTAARAADLLDFVFLVSTVRQLIADESPFVLADANVEGATTRFATTREDSERMLYRLRALTDSTALRGAELLVPGRLPLSAVSLIGVANDRVRERVRGLLAGADVAPKIAVYPPWFQPSE